MFGEVRVVYITKCVKYKSLVFAEMNKVVWTMCSEWLGHWVRQYSQWLTLDG